MVFVSHFTESLTLVPVQAIVITLQYLHYSYISGCVSYAVMYIVISCQVKR